MPTKALDVQKAMERAGYHLAYDLNLSGEEIVISNVVLCYGDSIYFDDDGAIANALMSRDTDPERIVGILAKYLD